MCALQWESTDLCTPVGIYCFMHSSWNLLICALQWESTDLCTPVGIYCFVYCLPMALTLISLCLYASCKFRDV